MKTVLCAFLLLFLPALAQGQNNSTTHNSIVQLLQQIKQNTTEAHTICTWQATMALLGQWWAPIINFGTFLFLYAYINHKLEKYVIAGHLTQDRYCPLLRATTIGLMLYVLLSYAIYLLLDYFNVSCNRFNIMQNDLLSLEQLINNGTAVA